MPKTAEIHAPLMPSEAYLVNDAQWNVERVFQRAASSEASLRVKSPEISPELMLTPLMLTQDLAADFAPAEVDGMDVEVRDPVHEAGEDRRGVRDLEFSGVGGVFARAEAASGSACALGIRT